MVRVFVSVLIALSLCLSSSWAGVPQAKPAETDTGRRDVKVWVNTRSGVYHCRGTRWYGNTRNGEYMLEKQAQDHGYRAASGRLCSAPMQTEVPLGDSTALPQARPGQCGFERWPVKILGDKDRNQVEWKAIETSITNLGSIPKPKVPYPYDHRIAPEELHVYKVRAKLLRVLVEQDSDLHLLLSDPTDEQSHMIVEIPAPECALGTGHEDEYRSARDTALHLRLGGWVEVVGVGFFDFLHEQSGAAPNGIELHPVLSIRPARQ